MAVRRCLTCYEPLPEGDLHAACSRKFFGTPEPPEFPYELRQMQELALEVVRRSVSVTGVQAKLSVDLSASAGGHTKRRLTIVGMWGRYILKPPTEDYPSLPKIEDLTMHIAALCKLRTAPHTLIRMASGELAYITKRMDRTADAKLPMEDMCQLTERLTEDKYKGSMEQIGKVLTRYSDNPGFDLVELLRTAMVSFLTGNADTHLKNYSLLAMPDGVVSLAPAYDLVATTLVLPEDREESALTLNGKKNNLHEADFRAFARTMRIPQNVYENTLAELREILPAVLHGVTVSFLSEALKDRYTQLVKERSARLGL